ncbi:ATP-binding protein [Chitinibacter tainanensis]|uniref:ATP-binding protein n=1 Tax=Chitinibacter tainanensis TaxID=230667 RepID=UPI00040AA540|nr:AAA family ATPase [Chitinibacter tainanensis]
MSGHRRRVGARQISPDEIVWNQYLALLSARYLLADELYIQEANGRVFQVGGMLGTLLPYLQFDAADFFCLRECVILRQRSLITNVSDQVFHVQYLAKGAKSALNVPQLLSRYAQRQPDGYQALISRSIQYLDRQLNEFEGVRPYSALDALISLTPTERVLIDFILCKSDSLDLPGETGKIGSNNNDKIKFLAQMLGCLLTELKSVISKDSRLFGAGIIHFEDEDWGETSSEFVKIGDNFDACINFKIDINQLRERLFPVPIDITEERAPVELLDGKFEDLLACLNGALKTRQSGINLLIRGVPGSGKMAIAKTLLQQLSVPGYCQQKPTGRKGSAFYRLADVTLLQNLLEKGRGVLVVECADDFFPKSQPSEFGLQITEGKIKNHKLFDLLANNAIPTIWLINHELPLEWEVMDFFQVQLLLSQVKPTQRNGLVNTLLANLPVSDSLKQALANKDVISDSEIAAVAEFAKLAHQGNPQHDLDEAILRQLKEGRLARDGEEVTLAKGKSSECQLRFLNLKLPVPIAQVISAVQRNGHGKLCFFGAPGTGKTCLAEYIAQEINRPLLRYTAADLLGKYVGESEKALKKMFVAAAEAKAVLLLDEADSFFQKREFAHNSWEVTQVNELLQQMEQFDGVFICTTNFVNALDPAVIRRFSLMVEFLPLSTEQRIDLLKTTLKSDDLYLDEILMQRLGRLDSLTAGDFHAAKQQDWLLGTSTDPLVWLERLERIHANKGPNKHKIGF